MEGFWILLLLSVALLFAVRNAARRRESSDNDLNREFRERLQSLEGQGPFAKKKSASPPQSG